MRLLIRDFGFIHKDLHVIQSYDFEVHCSIMNVIKCFCSSPKRIFPIIWCNRFFLIHVIDLIYYKSHTLELVLFISRWFERESKHEMYMITLYISELNFFLCPEYFPALSFFCSNHQFTKNYNYHLCQRYFKPSNSRNISLHET